MFSDRTNWKLTRNRLTEALEEVRASGGACSISRFRIQPGRGCATTRRGFCNRWPRRRRWITILSRLACRARGRRCGLLRESPGVRHFDPERLIFTTSTSEAYSFVSACCAIPAMNCWFRSPAIRCLSFSPTCRTSGWRLIPDLRSRLADGFSFVGKSCDQAHSRSGCGSSQ